MLDTAVELVSAETTVLLPRVAPRSELLMLAPEPLCLQWVVRPIRKFKKCDEGEGSHGTVKKLWVMEI